MKIYIFIFFTFFLIACQSSKDTNRTIEQENIEPDYLVEPIKWVWVDNFDKEQKEKLKIWISQVYEATMQTLGQYPFQVTVYFHTSDSDRTPVSFGYATRKGGINQTHFYVNPTATIESLLEYWIAPHELSHLAIPFLGKKNKWFTEGFATFLSRKTLIEMGEITEVEFDEMYLLKIKETKKYYNSTTSTFIEVSDSLMTTYNYGTMYWGASSFFYTLDQRLKNEKEMRFTELIQQYQECCHFETCTLLELMDSFDGIIGETWCKELMTSYRNEASFKVMQNY